MGNNPSKTPADVPSASSTSVEKRLNQRPSINALSGTAKATAADPSASKETATGYSAAQNAASVQRRLQSRNVADSPTRDIGRSDGYDAKKTEPVPSGIPFAPDPSDPVQVPASRTASRHDPFPHDTPPALPHNTYYNAPTHLQRPPRMPLPIGDATATPGSPGPSASHTGSLPYDRVLDEEEDPDASAVETTTIDEDEIVDELQPYTISGVGKAVPTTIQWTGYAQKVYVTGTFVNWEKKFRLHRKYVLSRLLSYPRAFPYSLYSSGEACSYPV